MINYFEKSRKYFFYSRSLKFYVMILAVILIPDCNKRETSHIVLFDRIKPAQAARAILFLEKNNIDFQINTDGRAITIKVPMYKAEILKRYLIAPIESSDYICLIKNGFVRYESPSEISPNTGILSKYLTSSHESADSEKIGVIFDTVFCDSKWKSYRSEDYEIIVEFTGKIPQNISNNKPHMEIITKLTGNKEHVFLEIGPGNSLWNCKWIINIDGKTFIKKSFRVIPGRFYNEIRTTTGPLIYINL